MYIAKLPTIIDSFLTHIANTTSLWGGGWRVDGNHRVASKDYINTENNSLASTGTIFNSIYNIKQLNL